MPGMVDAPVLDRMKTLNGEVFDQLWLQSMIAHHQGAIAMSNAELSGASTLQQSSWRNRSSIISSLRSTRCRAFSRGKGT